MAVLFLDGFDKYGPANSNNTTVAALMAGEWTTIGGGVTIVAPLSATGQAAQLFSNTGTLTKTLSSNYGRIIGGVRFNCNLTTNTAGIQFQDAGSAQCGIGIATTGIISVRNGSYTSGTILGSASSAISASTTHYLEWDITLGNSASYYVYLDGVLIISGTGDTTATANNTINGIQFTQGAGPTTIWDDLYVFDSTGTVNNGIIQTSPRIETTFPTSDSSVQFSVGASVLGQTVARATSGYASPANNLYVRPFTPSRSCTINSISLMPALTNAAVSFRPVIYADSAGVPGTLMSAGSTVLGMTSGVAVLMPLTTPQTLTAGVQYWLGFMNDVAAGGGGLAFADTSTVGRNATSTFSSGAPGTAPAMATNIATVLLWGNITLASAVNYYEVNQQPPPAANTSYVTDTTVGHEDLYGFPALSAAPASVYVVGVKAFCERSDSGARTVSLRMSSGGTDSGGSSTGQTPGTSYAWIGSYFATDPNGSIPWSGTTLNAATTGFKIDA